MSDRRHPSDIARDIVAVRRGGGGVKDLDPLIVELGGWLVGDVLDDLDDDRLPAPVDPDDG